MSKSKIAIVGIGEVPTGIHSQRLPWEIIYETCSQAVTDSGLDKNDIEAVVTVAPQAQALAVERNGIQWLTYAPEVQSMMDQFRKSVKN